MFRMFQGKVGPARKILQYIKNQQQKSNEPEVSRDHIQEDTTFRKTQHPKKMNTEELSKRWKLKLMKKKQHMTPVFKIR